MSNEASLSPLTIDINGTALSYDPLLARRRRRRAILVACVVVVALAALAIPAVGHADAIAEIQKWFIDSFLADAAANIFKLGVDQLKAAVNGPTGIFTSNFDQILGERDAPGVYQAIKSVSDNGVKPIAATLFTLVILMEFLKISQRADMHQTLPLFKEVMTFMCFVVLYMFIIRNGFDIVSGLYEVVHKIQPYIATIPDVKAGDWDAKTIHDAIVNADPAPTIGSVLIFMVLSAVMAAAVFGANIKVTIAGWMLGIQLYVQAAFAPLAFVFFAYEGTKQWALGYIRHFLSLAMNGIIIMILLYMLAVMVSSVIPGVGNDTFDLGQWGPANFIKCFAILFMFVKAIGESDRWSSQVFGG